MTKQLRRLLQGLQTFYADYAWLYERQQLRMRPWEEDLLHWSRDGDLHGDLLPPADGRRHSVTSDGWCPGLTGRSDLDADR